MGPRALGLLVMSSALNAALSFFVFAFALYSTSPDMPEVTLRIGFYVLNGAGAAAVAAVFLPWVFARKNFNRSAVFFALFPFLALCLAALAFLTLGSWLERTFS